MISGFVIQIGDMLVADWFLYGLIGIIALVLVTVFYWFYQAKLKIGFKAVVCVMVNGKTCKQDDGSIRVLEGLPRVIGKKEFKAGDSEAVVAGTKCQIRMDHPAYQEHGWTYYYFEKLTGAIMTFGGSFASLSSQDSDEFLSDALLTRVIRMLKLSLRSELFWYILVIVMFAVGSLVGLLASPYVLPPQNGTLVFTR